jgi:hypothetical protein
MAKKIDVISLVNRIDSRRSKDTKITKINKEKSVTTKTKGVIKEVPELDMKKITDVITEKIEDQKKLINFSEKYEESLIKQLFEEELKDKVRKHLDQDESEYYEEVSQKRHYKRNGD